MNTEIRLHRTLVSAAVAMACAGCYAAADAAPVSTAGFLTAADGLLQTVPGAPDTAGSALSLPLQNGSFSVTTADYGDFRDRGGIAANVHLIAADGGSHTAQNNRLTLQGCTVEPESGSSMLAGPSMLAGAALLDSLRPGGAAGTYASQGNQLTIADSTVTNAAVYGTYISANGSIGSLTADNNSLSITGSAFAGERDSEAVGAFVRHDANGDPVAAVVSLSGNTVDVSGSETAYSVTTSVLGASFNGYPWAPQATVTADNNTVTVSGLSLAAPEDDSFYGGRIRFLAAEVYGTARASLTGNRLVVKGDAGSGAFQQIFYSAEAIFTGGTTLRDNVLQISDTPVNNGMLFGAASHDATSLDATGNRVLIDGDTVIDGWSKIAGLVVSSGGDSTVNADGTSVTIGGNTHLGTQTFVWGLSADLDKTPGHFGHTDVVLTDNAVIGEDPAEPAIVNVFLGLTTSYPDDPKPKDPMNGTTADGTLTLSGNVSVANASLFGGTYAYELAESGKVGTFPDLRIPGKFTLKTDRWHGSVGQADFFTGIEIDAPALSETEPVLTIGQTGMFNQKATAPTVKLTGAASAASTLQAGSRVPLIRVENQSEESTVPYISLGGALPLAGLGNTREDGVFVIANEGEEDTVSIGKTAYTFTYTADPELLEVLMNITGIGLSAQGEQQLAQAKVFNEAAAGTAIAINAGADALIGQLSTMAAQPTFGGISGGHSRTKTGSTVDWDGVSLIAGASHTWNLANADMSHGIFFEAGWGDTTTRNAIGGATQKGTGDASYAGIGWMGRIERTTGTLAGVYGDASLRVGSAKNEYHNNDVTDDSGKAASMDPRTTYFGAHIGGGYKFDVVPAVTLDLSARYLWTHTNSKTVDFMGDELKLHAVNSHRVALNAQTRYTGSAVWQPYAGFGYEYEFGGKAKSTYLGYTTDSASLKGSTGILEAGVDVLPFADDRLTLRAGLRGEAGHREGISGQLGLMVKF